MHTPIAKIVFFVMLLLLVALVAAPVAKRIRLPFSAVLVIIGFLGSWTMAGGLSDLAPDSLAFHDLVFYVFLPVLIFESAFAIDSRLLVRNLGPILILAIPIMLFSALISGGLIYLGIDHPTGFPWIAALISGALLSATDPVAVVALLKEIGAPKRLATLIEGESLLNDATAIVAFTLALTLATNPQSTVGFGGAVLEFLQVFFGGLLVGVVVSFFALVIQRASVEAVVHGLVSVIASYCAFLIAENLLHVSGVMAVLALGLILGRARRSGFIEDDFVEQLWQFNAFIANSLVFLLMGFSISIDMFEERWLAILIGIGAVIVARMIGIFILVPVATRFTPEEPIDLRYRAVLFWGGLRGAVTLALALSIPKQLDYWWTIQSIAFGVVVFTLFVQAPTMNLLIRRTGLSG